MESVEAHHDGDQHGQPEHDEAHAEAQARAARLLRRSHTHPLARLAFSVFLSVIAIVLIGVAALGLRLAQGPLAVPALKERMQRQMAQVLPEGMRFALRDVTVERRDTGLVFVANAPGITDAAGKSVIGASAVVTSLDITALLTGHIRLASLTLEQPTLPLIVRQNGHIDINGLPPMGTMGEATPAVALAAIDLALRSPEAPQEVTIRQMRVTIDDEKRGRSATLEPFDLTLRRTAAAGGLSLAMAGTSGFSVNVTIEERNDGTRLVDLHARDVPTALIASALVPDGPPPDLQTVITLLGRARIGATGSLEQASLSMDAKAGRWIAGPEARPFNFDAANVAMSYDAEQGAIVVNRAAITAGEGAAAFTGTIRPPAEGAPPIWIMAFESNGLTIAGTKPGEPPLRLDSAVIHARYDPRIVQLGLDSAEFSGPTAGLSAKGSMTFGAKAPGIGLAFSASRMPVTALKRFWPFFAVPDARHWFADNVNGGTVESATLSLNIPLDVLAPVNGKVPPLADEAVRGEFSFDGASLRFLDSFPPMTQTRAKSVFTGRTFIVDLEAGQLVAGNQAMQISEGRYEIKDLAIQPPDTAMNFRLTGPAGGIARLMKLEPLATVTKSLDLDPRGVTGDADLKVVIRLPLSPEVKPETVDYAVNGTLSGMTIDGFEGNRLEAGNLTVDLSKKLISVAGKGQFAGAPATVSYKRGEGEAPVVKLSVTLDEKAREKRGFKLGSALTGPVRVDVDLASATAQTDGFAVTVDLTAARVADLIPGWQKPAGRAGKASFTWLPRGGGGAITELSLSAGTVALTGSGLIDDSGVLQQLNLTSIKMQPGDDARLALQRVGSGWRIVLAGDAFDLRQALRALQRSGPGTGDLTLEMTLENAIGFNNVALSKFRLSLAQSGDVVNHLSLTGQFDDQPVSIDLGKGSKGEPLVQVKSTDAGSLLRFLDLYSKVSGGTIDARVTPDPKQSIGVVFVRDFVVKNEPALGQFFSNAQPVPNKGGNGDVLAPTSRGNDARFTKLRLGFARTPDRVSITEAVVWGPEVGANLTGSIDYAASRINVTGTFVPAYALNNLFSQIPLLGPLLGGGQYEGLFAVTFKVSGPMSNPTLTVNPLSGIAPGFLRKLFEFQKE